ncbi:hypothetical protein [Litoreibacter janthinus]|uniref:Uncharacterized protein n=1 Tax=Litoreibacter janthinus TaxID=670154 RepID=A0A1I6GIE0_9RHOB|nr:hypothetical protein [Litoreibacter janthinus]SFR41965.1 hypothetical protein SAMN04488002_1528 [Litoreibacter janthinus]
MKILAVILAFIFMALAIGYWVLSGAPSIGVAPRKTPPPDGFDATQFPTISELTSNGSIHVVDLSQFGTYFEHYYIPDVKVTYFILFAGDDLKSTVFVNDKGAVIGTITQKPSSFPMGRYFIDYDGYHEVTASGVSTLIPHQLIKEPLSADALKRMIEESTHYRKYSWSDSDRNSPDYAAKLDTHLMRHQGVWKKVVMTVEEYHDWKGTNFTDLDVQYRADRTVSDEDKARFYNGKYTLQLTHFDQQDYVRGRGAPMGSPTGQGTPEQWRGTGYYTLSAGDESLNFSIPNDSLILSGGGRVSLMLGGGADLDFVVLRHEGRGQQRDVFVVSSP